MRPGAKKKVHTSFILSVDTGDILRGAEKLSSGSEIEISILSENFFTMEVINSLTSGINPALMNSIHFLFSQRVKFSR